MVFLSPFLFLPFPVLHPQPVPRYRDCTPPFRTGLTTRGPVLPPSNVPRRGVPLPGEPRLLTLNLTCRRVPMKSSRVIYRRLWTRTRPGSVGGPSFPCPMDGGSNTDKNTFTFSVVDVRVNLSAKLSMSLLHNSLNISFIH